MGLTASPDLRLDFAPEPLTLQPLPRPESAGAPPKLPPILTGGKQAALPVPQMPVRRIRRARQIARTMRRAAVAITAAVAALGVAGGIYWVARSGMVSVDPVPMRDQIAAGLLSITGSLGLRIEDVLVEGRDRMDPAQLAAALAVARGQPILGFDAKAARERLEAIPWIESATVERRLPDTVYVRMVERQPLALWQHEGRFSVIDAKGRVVLDRNVGAYASLPLVVGDDAPADAEGILMILATEPDLKKRVAAAVRVGGRRWNVRMDNGVEVRLPEDDAASAWSQLAEFERKEKILSRDVVAIDFRLGDRMIVQTSPGTAEKLRGGPDKKSALRG